MLNIIKLITAKSSAPMIISSPHFEVYFNWFTAEVAMHLAIIYSSSYNLRSGIIIINFTATIYTPNFGH